MGGADKPPLKGTRTAWKNVGTRSIMMKFTSDDEETRRGREDFHFEKQFARLIL